MKDEGNRKWGLRHVIFSALMLIVLVMYKKYKNRIVVTYMQWYVHDHMDEFLSRFKSLNNLSVPKVTLAMRRDFNSYLKTRNLRGEKTVRDFKENVDAYFAGLDGEITAASRAYGCEWDWAENLYLEKNLQPRQAIDLEAYIAGKVKANVEEHFQGELDTFMARFDFQGAEQEAIRHSNFYWAFGQGWHLSYDEVSRALWKKFREWHDRI